MLQNLKNALRPLIPAPLLQARRVKRLAPLVSEIHALGIMETGFDAQRTPWVRLQSGHIFYGLGPTEDESLIYQIVKKHINSDLITIDCFGVVYEIISRYKAPRSIPGELVRHPSTFDRMRDPINDFTLSVKEREAIANRFIPQKGDIIFDIGACHGFGTMKLAEYVGSTGKVIAVEANPVSAAILKKNIKANKFNNITLLEMAVSNYKKSDGHFFVDGVATGNSLRPDVLEGLGVNKLSKMNIEIDTGDNILANLGIDTIDYLNVTVNGGEPEVIIGLSETISRSRKMAVTMPGWYYRDGKRLDKLLSSHLSDLGFANIKTGKLGRIIAWQ